MNEGPVTVSEFLAMARVSPHRSVSLSVDSSFLILEVSLGRNVLDDDHTPLELTTKFSLITEEVFRELPPNLFRSLLSRHLQLNIPIGRTTDERNEFTSQRDSWNPTVQELAERIYRGQKFRVFIEVASDCATFEVFDLVSELTNEEPKTHALEELLPQPGGDLRDLLKNLFESITEHPWA